MKNLKAETEKEDLVVGQEEDLVEDSQMFLVKVIVIGVTQKIGTTAKYQQQVMMWLLEHNVSSTLMLIQPQFLTQSQYMVNLFG